VGEAVLTHWSWFVAAVITCVQVTGCVSTEQPETTEYKCAYRGSPINYTFDSELREVIAHIQPYTPVPIKVDPWAAHLNIGGHISCSDDWLSFLHALPFWHHELEVTLRFSEIEIAWTGERSPPKAK
jgi:hypothetical protein